MTTLDAARLVADCIATGRHFARTVVYTGEQVPRCHMCGCPRGWQPPARRLTAPTGQPVIVHGPTLLPAGGPTGQISAMPISLFGRPPAVRDVLPCGTPAGYIRHRRDLQDPCPDCRAAHNAYTSARARARRAARREQVAA
jgi:hypothetical protein